MAQERLDLLHVVLVPRTAAGAGAEPLLANPDDRVTRPFEFEPRDIAGQEAGGCFAKRTTANVGCESSARSCGQLEPDGGPAPAPIVRADPPLVCLDDRSHHG